MVLKSFDSYRRVWIEISSESHKHGGTGWEFGTCLWSPTRNRGGNDGWAAMRGPIQDDLVLHFYENKWDSGPPSRSPERGERCATEATERLRELVTQSLLKQGIIV